MTREAEEIKDRVAANLKKAAEGEKENKSNNTTRATLAAVILLMSFVTIAFFVYRQKVAPVNTQKPVVIERIHDNGHVDLKKKVEDLDKKVSNCLHKIWLLNVAHNENVNLTTVINQQHGWEDPELIYFEANGKLNRLPKTMGVDESVKKDLEKDLK